MNSTYKRRTALLLIATLCCAPVIISASGCAKNDPPSEKEGYYNGPMQGKGKAATDPSLTKGGAKTE